jgi:cation:H+ antiporter
LAQILQVWLEFAACLALIAAAGPHLSRSGDIIGAKTGLSGNWIGLALLATVTSLPELITGISAVTVAGAPEIAVGDVFGSCVLNLAIFAVLDLFSQPAPMYGRVDRGHIISAAFGAILIAFAGLSILLPSEWVLSLGHVGFYTPILLVLYAIALRSVSNYQRRRVKERAKDTVDRYPDITLRAALVRYAVAGALVVAAGTWLPFVGVDLAEAMGWQRSFVGTLFVAGATSAPELVVSLAALRLGAADMAVANLLGSNLFDMAILAVDDMLFFSAPLLSVVSPAHAISAFTAVVMTGLAIVGLIYRPQKALFGSVSWVSLGILAMYLMNSFALYIYAR